MLRYRIKLEPDDNGALLVTSPDLPGVVTFGVDRADAARRAVETIEEWIAAAISDGTRVPRPRRRSHVGRGEIVIQLPALTALKVELYWALYDAKITRAELSRRLKWNRESVDRLFRLDHASRLSQIEQAARALEKDIDVRIRKTKEPVTFRVV
jgi:antitoxin HicB